MLTYLEITNLKPQITNKSKAPMSKKGWCLSAGFKYRMFQIWVWDLCLVVSPKLEIPKPRTECQKSLSSGIVILVLPWIWILGSWFFGLLGQIHRWIVVKEIKRSQFKFMPKNWHYRPVFCSDHVMHSDSIP